MAFLVFVLIFIGLPLAELAVLLESSENFGLPRTLALCIFTGVLGASLAKWQGAQTLRLIQKDLASGQMPTTRLVDGAMILCAGVVLLTPGFITDLIGFVVLFPLTRPIFREPLKHWLVKKIKSGTINVNGGDQAHSEQAPDDRDYIDVDEV